MKLRVLIGLLSLLISCQTRQEPSKSEAEVLTKADSLQRIRQDSIATAEEKHREQVRTDSLAAIAKSKPIWGERMTATGDFDGDGAQDTLFEKYISRLTGKETNKDYDWSGNELGDGCCHWLDYKQIWIAEKDPLVRLASKNPKIKSFDVEWGGVQNGFDYLKNVGDLNGDGTDEIAYYIYDVDFSNMNSCALAIYKNGKWKEVHHWNIHESDFYYDEKGEKPNPIYIRKINGKVYCREMADDWSGYVWKRLKTNW
ncbi:MAG: hypothetical protein OHK0019_06300 [Saprospiraceae bacterium]